MVGHQNDGAFLRNPFKAKRRDVKRQQSAQMGKNLQRFHLRNGVGHFDGGLVAKDLVREGSDEGPPRAGHHQLAPFGNQKVDDMLLRNLPLCRA